ncbi:MAG: N-acetylneuraminate synthase family protein [Parcubacteria group bacterium]|nr:N-acetylneuraminate synthase family protein [Parcubacteria group bacterium]
MRDHDVIWKKTQEGVFVVAEIGKNFIQKEEDDRKVYLENAKNLIKAAKDAGADAVKFQTHNVEDEQLNIQITSPHFDGADRYSWVKRNTEATPLEFWKALKEYADSLDIVMFTTPMSRGAAQRVASLDFPLWKVGSGDMLDFVLLDYLAETKKPIILSSGMSTIEELDRSVAFLKERTDKIAILHCVSKYPCPPEELFLDTIPYLKKRYGVPVGFSDHSLGYDAALVAVEKGAAIIEKHFTASRDLWGSDHKVSQTPDELREMIRAIQKTERRDSAPYGLGIKEMDEHEKSFRPVFRKSLMAGQDIPSGTVITKEMVYAMRPQQYAGGLPSEEYENVVGKKAAKDFKKYDPITADSIS